jgi:CheY-like chemotaxis protein
LGEGTSIILHLPRASAVTVGTVAEAPEIRASGYLADGPRTVLLVEDNDEVARLAAEMFEGLGFSVRRVSSAPAALVALERDKDVDLVFSDIVMPGGMNGVELARELRRRQPDLPVILTTGYSDAVRDCAAVAGFQLLQKPYRLHALEAALKAAMTESSARPDLQKAADTNEAPMPDVSRSKNHAPARCATPLYPAGRPQRRLPPA